MVTFGQCYIFALEFFGSRGINLSEAQMSEFCYSLLAFTEAAQQSVQPTVLTLCPECGVEQIVTHLPTCAHYVAQSG